MKTSIPLRAALGIYGLIQGSVFCQGPAYNYFKRMIEEAQQAVADAKHPWTYEMEATRHQPPDGDVTVCEEDRATMWSIYRRSVKPDDYGRHLAEHVCDFDVQQKKLAELALAAFVAQGDDRKDTSQLYSDDPVTLIAWKQEATEADAGELLFQPELDDGGRSPFYWLWLANGDLALACFPTGYVYEDTKRRIGG